MRYFSSSAGKGIVEKDAIQQWFRLNQQKFDPKKASEYARQFTKDYEAALDKIDKVPDIKRKSYLDFKNNIKDLFTYSDQDLIRLVKKDKVEKYHQLKMTQDLMQNGNAFKISKRSGSTSNFPCSELSYEGA